MNKQFIVDANGDLQDVNRPKIKVYPSIAAAQNALENGDLEVGELVTTEFVDGSADIALAAGLISDAVRLLNDRVDQIEGGESGLSEKISESATSTNKCPSTSEVTTSITNAINNLDATTIGDNTTYINSITQTNGIVTATTKTMPTFELVGDVLTITTGA